MFGLCLREGFGCERNEVKAAKYFERAAKAGYEPANAYLRLLATKAPILTSDAAQNEEKAKEAERLRERANAGDPDAAYRLGDFYLTGRGVERDVEKALEFFKRAADRRRVDAIFSVAQCYLFVLDEPTKAIPWLKKAADLGRAEAMNDLGVCYDVGRGVESSADVAFAWFKKAAEFGNADAMFNLGVHYERGIGAEKSAAQAARWYRVAADYGSVDAMFNVGQCYENGVGVVQSEAKAAGWYRIAADLRVGRRDAGAGALQRDWARRREKRRARGDLAASGGGVGERRSALAVASRVEENGDSERGVDGVERERRGGVFASSSGGGGRVGGVRVGLALRRGRGRRAERGSGGALVRASRARGKRRRRASASAAGRNGARRRAKRRGSGESRSKIERPRRDSLTSCWLRC